MTPACPSPSGGRRSWPPPTAAGMLLAHATPSLDGGALHLSFSGPDIAAAWRESGAQAALEGAMVANGIDMPVLVMQSVESERMTP